MRRRRCSSSVRVPTGSVRASSSTTHASTRRWPSPRQAIETDHGQLQPRDRLDGLRHGRPSLLRASHLRGCHGGLRTPRWPPAPCSVSSAPWVGRPRWARPISSRPQACRSSAPSLRPSTWPKTAASSGAVLDRAGLTAPKHGTAVTYSEAEKIAEEIGYPVLVRPSYVLGGRGMEIVYDAAQLIDYMAHRRRRSSPRAPVLVDSFLEDAIEIDVDALYDGTDIFIGGIMEHIEEAGIHSGDSACALPPLTSGRGGARARPHRDRARSPRARCARTAEHPVRHSPPDVLYVIEANPRASRTVPFVSKARALSSPRPQRSSRSAGTIADLRGGHAAVRGDGRGLPLDHHRSRSRRRSSRSERFRTGRGTVDRLDPRTGDALYG